MRMEWGVGVGTWRRGFVRSEERAGEMLSELERWIIDLMGVKFVFERLLITCEI